MGTEGTNCYRCGIPLNDMNINLHGDSCGFVGTPKSVYISWNDYRGEYLASSHIRLDLESFQYRFMASQDRLTSWLLTLGIECNGRD